MKIKIDADERMCYTTEYTGYGEEIREIGWLKYKFCKLVEYLYDIQQEILSNTLYNAEWEAKEKAEAKAHSLANQSFYCYECNNTHEKDGKNCHHCTLEITCH